MIIDIETKFNIEDEVYFLHNNKIGKFRVCEICVKRVKEWESERVFYHDYAMARTGIEEKFVFSSKEEAKKTLIKEIEEDNENRIKRAMLM